MNQQEQEKFNLAISDGYKELITKRPAKPLEHFIYHLLSTLPQEMRNKNQQMKEFYESYENEDLTNVKEI